MNFSNLATDKNRWIALVFLALGLAIVIIDNTVLNVAIPYILRDLSTSLDGIQWVVSGYALIIATLLITMGRLGDLYGRKKIFLLGTVFFAAGSFIASISGSVGVLFFGEAFIEAIGAAMMFTSTLSLLVSEFHGKERAIAFGIWGSVAGASATIGPLLGGYLTTYYSWRWSLRINVIVALIAILGSVFIKESRGEGEKRFDWAGTFLSGAGLFSLVFGFIEGRKYGWWAPNTPFSLFGWNWSFTGISIIPVAFAAAALLLILFVVTEYSIEKAGESPLLRLSMFKNSGFSIGLATLGIISLGQFGAFFVMPIYLQNVLGLDAFKTGIVFLPTSISIFIFGPLSGFIASRTNPKWVVNIGMFVGALGIYLLARALSTTATGWTLAPGFAILGVGIGMTSAQLTNIILSAAPAQLAGEASAANTTMRQVGTSIGIAVIGTVLAGSLATNIQANVKSDTRIPDVAKGQILESVKKVSIESGKAENQNLPSSPQVGGFVKEDINQSLVDSARKSFNVALVFVVIGSVISLLIPPTKKVEWEPQDTGSESSSDG